MRIRHTVVAATAAAQLCLVGCKGESSDRATQLDPAVESARTRGRELFFDRARCADCHAVGGQGNKVRGPNLAASGDYEEPVVVRAKVHRPDLAPIEYLVEATLAPDAHIVKTYAPGVMSAPDEPPLSLTDDEVVDIAVYLAGVGVDDPVTPAQLELARDAVAPAKRARSTSLQRKKADEALARLDLKTAADERGEALYKELQCGRCHDDPESEVPAPSLDGIAQRISSGDIVRWLIAPPESGMPSYAESLPDDALRDLVAWLSER